MAEKNETAASNAEGLSTSNALVSVGDKMQLVDDVIEPACGDHPAFLMGVKGEVVEVLEIRDRGLPYVVEGPTNKGKPWLAGDSDLKPLTH